jgi:hypothetical protein
MRRAAAMGWLGPCTGWWDDEEMKRWEDGKEVKKDVEDGLTGAVVRLIAICMSWNGMGVVLLR